MNPSHPVVILGAGLTGLSTALHLRSRPWRLVERENRVGGFARSHRREGYTFDFTGHWLHMSDPRAHDLMCRIFEPEEWLTVQRHTCVFSHNTILPYPFQANLFGLPPEVVEECLDGLHQANRPDTHKAPLENKTPLDFDAFVTSKFGAGIAKHFFVPYNTKLWGMHPNNLDSTYVRKYVPTPDPQQIIEGARSRSQAQIGYNVTFQSAKRGGIDLLADRLLERATSTELSSSAASADTRSHRVDLGTTVEEIDSKNKRLKLSSEPNWVPYSQLVSSIPLPRLLECISDLPEEVRSAGKKLRAVDWKYIDIATSAKPSCDYHWIYVPEPQFDFFRVGVYSNANPAMAPDGGGSAYVELNDRDSEPNLPEIFEQLVKLGTIGSVSDVRFAEVRTLPSAYVVFDKHWKEATQVIHSWLATVGIRSCGRYGEWTYDAMQDAVVAGMDAAAWAGHLGNDSP